ncbi:FtsX-like permease family protein [bacterium]|nr:FtsX-like permease family protein [bacterium]
MNSDSLLIHFLTWIFGQGHQGDETVTIANDILEYYTSIIKTEGRLEAAKWMTWQLVGSVCSLIYGKLKWRQGMLKNYLKIGVRNLKKNRVYTVINIVGLSVAIAWSLLVFHYVYDEFNYDKFHRDIDQLALVNTENSRYEMFVPAHAPLGQMLVADQPEVIGAVRLNRENSFIKIGSEISEVDLLATDSGFFSIFSFPMKWGSGNALDNQPRAIYLSEETAFKYYGNVNPLGNTIAVNIDDKYEEFEIAGVFAKIPGASSLTFSHLISINHFLKDYGTSWDDNASLIIKINAGTEMDDFISGFDDITRPYLDPLSDGEYLKYNIMPFADFHLHHDGFFFFPILEGASTIQPSLVLIGIALLILLLASINYVNLALACMTRRIKEIGIYKMMGAARKQIIQQLLGESIIVILITFTVGFLLSQWVLPAFSLLTGKSITSFNPGNPMLLYFMAGLSLLLLSVIAIYPAAILSKIELTKILHSRYRLSSRNFLSKCLIIFQFAISVFLIIVTLVISKQHKFMMSDHFGSDLNNVIEVNLDYSIKRQQLTHERVLDFKAKLLSAQGVSGVVCASYRLGGAATIRKDRDGNNRIVCINQVEPDYFNALGLKMDKWALPEDEKINRYLVVTRSYADAFLEANPLGQLLERAMYGHSKDSKIVGVVEDFNTQSLKSDMTPQVIEINPDAGFSTLYIRFNSEHTKSVVNMLKREYEVYWPDTLIEYHFISDIISEFYVEEARWKKIVKISAFVALFIACSGLFGLSLLVIVRRTKEISIRQVLGASSVQLHQLVQKDFLRLVVTGILLACPLSYWCARSWLNDFAHRTPISWWIFVVGAFIAFLTAMLTIGIQVIRNINKDPAANLRIE